jgi:hypothetical protein
MMEFSTSHFGFFAKKAKWNGKFHHITVLESFFKNLYWKFPSYFILTFIDLYCPFLDSSLILYSASTTSIITLPFESLRKARGAERGKVADEGGGGAKIA